MAQTIGQDSEIQGAKTKSDISNVSENEIRQFLDNFTEAIREGDIQAIMSYYADDFVAYDMMPPLKFTSKAVYQQNWEKCFTESFDFPVYYQCSEQTIFAEENLAYVHNLVHMIGSLEETGQKMDNWFRGTLCLRKLDGKWLIVHEHNSVPMDNDGKGLFSLKPDEPSSTEDSVH